jgi:hypothetical protein
MGAAMSLLGNLTFQGLSATQAYVLGKDGNLWLENAPWGHVPPSREQVDGNVAAFQALSATQAYVLGKDGNLWLENAPWGHVPPSREQVDGNVAAPPPLPPLPPLPPPPPSVDWKWDPITFPSGTAANGRSELKLDDEGNVALICWMHDSGIVAYNCAVAWAVRDSKGNIYTATASGSINGGDWNSTQTAVNATLAENWSDLTYTVQAGVDINVGVLLDQLLKDIETVAGIVLSLFGGGNGGDTGGESANGGASGTGQSTPQGVKTTVFTGP